MNLSEDDLGERIDRKPYRVQVRFIRRLDTDPLVDHSIRFHGPHKVVVAAEVDDMGISCNSQSVSK